MDICKYVTESLCHTPETNTTLEVNYNPIKINLNIKINK